MNYLVDTHAHLNSEKYKVITSDLWQHKSLGFVVFNIGTTVRDSKKAIDLAIKFSNMKAVVGLHPTESVNYLDDSVKQIEKIIQENSDHVIGVGECGLDYFWEDSLEKRILQEDLFRQQIELAITYDLPLTLHVRPQDGFDAYERTLEILKEYKKEKQRGVAHFFAGDEFIANEFLGIGFDVSFTGVITFAPDPYYRVIKQIPLERIHAETDCPYLAPAPFRGKINQPNYVFYTLQKIAEIKELELNSVIKQLAKNASRLWNFPQI